MEKVFTIVLIIILSLSLCACSQGTMPDNSHEYLQENVQENTSETVADAEDVNTPEEVAAAYIESEAECDYDTFLRTLPIFRLRYTALNYVNDNEVALDDLDAVAKAMKEKRGENKEKQEILNVYLVEYGEFTDAPLFDKLNQKYTTGVTKEEFDQITEYATVMVEFTLDNHGTMITLDREIGCIKMGNQWYVLSVDGRY